MKANRRFSLLTFPQFFDGATSVLTLNVVVLPRNQNPLMRAIENSPPIPDAPTPAPAFADAKLSFVAKIISSLSNFPNSQLADDRRSLLTTAPTRARDLFVALGKNFQISNLNSANQSIAVSATAAVAEAQSVKKYLPVSYRQAFNFTTPRTRNAVTDDSYHCAIRNAENVPGFQRSLDDISWGQVFAFALRQPQLAQQLGIIYQTQLDIDAAHFPHGGWLYVDLADDSDYKTQQQADDSFINKYAARIPALKPGNSRQVFAPLLFPVLFKANAADPDPPRVGNYDNLFIEVASYDDGFAKIVHAHQPRSRNLLAEESDGAHPVKDVGVRLGWDDEQILIWYMRQLAIDSSVTDGSQRIDAPLGVFGYAIDVREMASPAKPWESLNEVKSKFSLSVPKDKNDPDQVIEIGRFDGELSYQVYPAQLGGKKTDNYWLPMYFANWNGHSMVLPDTDAAKIYHTTNPDVQPDPETATNGTGASGPAQNQLSRTYDAARLDTKLRYGKSYEFRIRLRDLSGGGTPLHPTVEPLNKTTSNVGQCSFKRYVPPHQPRVSNLPFNVDTASAISQLSIRRPLLGYPAVVYTGKYADAVGLLEAASQEMIQPDPLNQTVKEASGIEDPDVNRIEVTVEVQTLSMDNLLSVSGKENYVHLYTAYRNFPAINNEGDYRATLNIPIVYKDCKVLHTGPELKLKSDLRLPDEIDKLEEIFVPTARTIRLTLRAVCEDKARNEEYYGLLDNQNPAMDVRFGHTVQVMLYKASEDETNLFVETSASQKLQGLYLQPDAPNVLDGNFITLLIGKEVLKAPDMIQRLAKQLGIENLALTLTASKGERIQFGCSNRIRHTLSPEKSSLTFSSKGDLMNHWLCCVSLELDRDWTWDALMDRALVIRRTVRFTHDDITETEIGEAGDIEIRRTAPFEALDNPQRNFTRLIFIDAVEPKSGLMQPSPLDKEPRFPDTIEVTYSIEAQFKPGHAPQPDDRDADESLEMTLPITTPPAQIPKIASAGIALSPYNRNEKYSATEPRRRFLWIEFAEPVRDSKDTFFARVLAYAPDQLISNNQGEQFIAPDEPSLPLDPELIRVITRDSSNDLAGLTAMQPMQRATDSDRHYLLPLPPGIHADAAEMFGFFTYEFRVGHYRHRDTNEMAWSTAQGRFGRPLRATGIQHPAPTLVCSVNRDPEKLYVSAPYAAAVFKGKNVTADPPRTQLWCLLYAQVRQADNTDFRNILLDDKQLDWRVQIETDKRVKRFLKYDEQERQLLKYITIRNWKDELDYGNLQHVFKLAETKQLNKDATKYGTVVWSNQEIDQLLQLYGLPENSPLSILVVEILPTITNTEEHINGYGQREVRDKVRKVTQINLPSQTLSAGKAGVGATLSDYQQAPSPLSDTLGHQRILRTSPLNEVPFVC